MNFHVAEDLEEFLDQLSVRQVFEKDSAPWSALINVLFNATHIHYIPIWRYRFH
jgi:hypothetical protein